MDNSDHTTRTLLLSRVMPNLLLVSRGSNTNLDIDAANIESGHSQIRAFNLGNRTGVYDYGTDGLRLGWGLRNSVGVGEHPVTGGIYSVENSADNIERDGQNIHENNPGEEMNFHGYLNGSGANVQGKNYGYPYCYAVWQPSEIPRNSNLTIGKQFAIDAFVTLEPVTFSQDSFCNDTVPPRLTFQAHMAPLDIKFNNSGTEAWVAMHGSWNRNVPSGYKLSVVAFNNETGQPVPAANSDTGYADVLTNQDITDCPDHCFRPAGLAIDGQGRIFMSSDATGEIWVVLREDAANTTGGPATATASGTGPSHTASDAYRVRQPAALLALIIFTFFLCL